MAKARSGTLLADVLQIEEQKLPAEAETLVALCLSPDARARPSAQRAAAALRHILTTLEERSLERDGSGFDAVPQLSCATCDMSD
jgi:hypothetical protein